MKQKDIHFLTIHDQMFRDIMNGKIDFIIRDNNKKIDVGEIIILEEKVGGSKTGKKSPPREITYIFDGGVSGLSENKCIIQSRPLGTTQKPESYVPSIDLYEAKAMFNQNESLIELCNEYGPINIQQAVLIFYSGYCTAKIYKND